MEIFDPENPGPVPKMKLEFPKHAETCPSYASSMHVPGHPLLTKYCKCRAIPRPKPLELDVKVLVRDSEPVHLETFGDRLTLTVCDWDGFTRLTPAAAQAIGQHLVNWVESIRWAKECEA